MPKKRLFSTVLALFLVFSTAIFLPTGLGAQNPGNSPEADAQNTNPAVTERNPMGKSEPTAARSVITLYPFAFIRSAMQLAHHQAVGARGSLVTLGAVGFAENYDLYGYETENFLSIRGELQYRVFLSGKQLNGAYAGGYVQYKHLNLKSVDYWDYDPITQQYRETDQHYTSHSGSVGLVIGYQWVWNWFSLDLYGGGGPQYAWGDYRKVNIPVIDQHTRGMQLNLGVAVGIKLK